VRMHDAWKTCCDFEVSFDQFGAVYHQISCALYLMQSLCLQTSMMLAKPNCMHEVFFDQFTAVYHQISCAPYMRQSLRLLGSMMTAKPSCIHEVYCDQFLAVSDCQISCAWCLDIT
jgi:hypothetical protein